MTRDSCQLLIQCATGTTVVAYAVQTLAVNLNALVEQLSQRLQPQPVAFFQACAPKLHHLASYAVLEMQEHLETFFDKRHHAVEVSIFLSNTLVHFISRNIYKQNIILFIYSLYVCFSVLMQ